MSALSTLLRLRARSQTLRDGLFCSRSFFQRPATPDRDCHGVVAGHASREERGIILAWMTKNGPFLEDDRYEEEHDYFEFEGSDVTDQGLGEAARRIGASQLATVFSFIGGAINFERTPLSVQHGLAESPIKFLAVPNVWDSQSLLEGAQGSLPDPTSWETMVEYANLTFDRVLVSDAILTQLSGTTFYPAVSRRVIELLRILQNYMEGRRQDGTAGQRSNEIHQQFFTGERARFTDESSNNKNEFRHEMTFKDPEDQSRTIFCPWHGKIQTPQFRIHFEWPVPPNQTRLKVMYVGPKITKT